MFLALGILAGIIMGLIPGIHPNMIILLVPVIAALNINPLSAITFIVALGITNTLVDFIPSIFLGAPEAGTELSVLPGHRMLLKGHGYEAVRLCVIGSLGALIFIILLFPIILFLVPALYSTISEYIYVLLLCITGLMILTEKGSKKLVALLVFFLAGAIGLTMQGFPLNPAFLLFPIFSGLFGLSVLLLGIKKKTKIPRQKNTEIYSSRKGINRAVILGSLGGIVSGFLPGVGSSEITSIATLEKNDRSFLVTSGALTTANMILSILCLWLINKPRSGLAVAVDQLASIGLSEVFFIVIIAVISLGVGAFVTLRLSRYFSVMIDRINYVLVCWAIIFIIVALTFVFTGVFGLFLLCICTALGIFTNLAGIKRGNLMAVLILPTLVFYLGFA